MSKFTLIVVAALACVFGAVSPALAVPAVHGNSPTTATSRVVLTPANRCPPSLPHCGQH